MKTLLESIFSKDNLLLFKLFRIYMIKEQL